MTNTTEMPEKIWASSETGNGWSERNLGGVSYTRTDTIPDVAELQRQNAALKAFARMVINPSFEGGELDGGQIQEKADESGILIPKTVTQEMMDEWSKNDSYPQGDADFIKAG